MRVKVTMRCSECKQRNYNTMKNKKNAADIAKGVPHARQQDNAMSEARHKVDWEAMFDLALDQDKARRYFESTPPADRHTCSMCGKMCAVRTTNLILGGKQVEFCTEK